jgi:hypothetical protein
MTPEIWTNGTWTFDESPATETTQTTEATETVATNHTAHPQPSNARLIERILTALVPFPDARLAVATLLFSPPAPA